MLQKCSRSTVQPALGTIKICCIKCLITNIKHFVYPQCKNTIAYLQENIILCSPPAFSLIFAKNHTQRLHLHLLSEKPYWLNISVHSFRFTPLSQPANGWQALDADMCLFKHSEGVNSLLMSASWSAVWATQTVDSVRRDKANTERRALPMIEWHFFRWRVQYVLVWVRVMLGRRECVDTKTEENVLFSHLNNYDKTFPSSALLPLRSAEVELFVSLSLSSASCYPLVFLVCSPSFI